MAQRVDTGALEPETGGRVGIVPVVWRALNTAEVLRIALEVPPLDAEELRELTNELLVWIQRLVGCARGDIARELAMVEARRDVRWIQAAIGDDATEWRDVFARTEQLIRQLDRVLESITDDFEPAAEDPILSPEVFMSQRAAWSLEAVPIAALFTRTINPS